MIYWQKSLLPRRSKINKKIFQNYFIPLFIGIITYTSQYIFITNYGVNIPYWDQWFSETELYILYNSNSLTFEYLFSPHNEHRIFLLEYLI